MCVRSCMNREQMVFITDTQEPMFYPSDPGITEIKGLVQQGTIYSSVKMGEKHEKFIFYNFIILRVNFLFSIQKHTKQLKIWDFFIFFSIPYAIKVLSPRSYYKNNMHVWYVKLQTMSKVI